MNYKTIKKVVNQKKQPVIQSRKILAPENVKSIIILIDDSVPDINIIQKQIKSLFSKSTTITVINLGRNERDDIIDVDIQKKNILGKLPKVELEKIKNQKCDLLINFVESDDLTVEYMAALIDAQLKVFKSINQGLVYDLNIKLKENSSNEYFIEQLFFYLSSLNSCKN